MHSCEGDAVGGVALLVAVGDHHGLEKQSMSDSTQMGNGDLQANAEVAL